MTGSSDGESLNSVLAGSPGRTRTSDLTVNSRPLYRLSYRGAISKEGIISVRDALSNQSRVHRSGVTLGTVFARAFACHHEPKADHP
jgi:hypothetical protein